VALTGHGPHPLPFDAAQSLEWREPPGRDDPRTPDAWTFALAGPAKVTLRIDGDGMAASLLAASADAGSPLGRLVAGTPLVIELAAGQYRVAASALGRNDRLAYSISLHSDELQPDTPRSVALPTEQAFAIATPRVVTVTSFGGVPLRAELRDAAGQVVARAVGRTDDWNIALSRFLPAGRYRLALAPLLSPAGRATSDADHDAQDTGSSGDGSSKGTQDAGSNGNASGNDIQDAANATGSGNDAQDAANATGSGNDAQDAGPSATGPGSDAQDAGSNGSGSGNDSAEPADGGSANGSAMGDAADQASDQSNTAQSTQGEGNQDQEANDTADQSAGGKPPARTEVTLLLPADQPEVPLPPDGAILLQAGAIQHVTLPTVPASGLLVAAAEAPVELILTLEHRTADGAWHTMGQDQGLAPVLAIPVRDAAAAWRASIWTVDGGNVPIRFAARGVTATPLSIAQGSAVPAPTSPGPDAQGPTATVSTPTVSIAPAPTVPAPTASGPLPPVALTPVALGGVTQHWNAALLADPGAAMLRLSGPAAGLLVASAPDQPAAPPAGGTIVAQSAAVWLLSPEPTSPGIAVVHAAPGVGLTIGVPAGGRANLPSAAPASSALCAYVAASGLGQPGLDAGRGMGVAPGSAFALCGGATLGAWNAGGDDPLRLRLQRHELALSPEVAVDQAFAGTLPPHSALRLSLPAGVKRLDTSLAAGGALVAGWQSADAVTVWAGDTALSRSLTGSWTDALLVNTGDSAVPATLAVTAVTQPEILVAGRVFRRFFGAGGSFALPVNGKAGVLPATGKAGQRLVLAGEATALVVGSDGQVRQGRAIALDGAATAVVTHGAGPVALWIEGPDLSPWPDIKPTDVKLPQRLVLVGDAMALRLSPGAPVLLRLASTAPVILAIGADPPVLFGKGMAMARYLPAGDTVLRLLSPQDGPLSGSLELSGSPVTEVGEGLGAAVAIAPGGAAVFGFTVAAAGPVGLGVRADPDRVAVRLLDEQGRTLEQGVSMLRQLVAGHYLLEASVPPDAPTTLARPAVLGIVPHRNPPPPEVVRGLLIAAGFAPPDGSR
jgi:hypothetical protein